MVSSDGYAKVLDFGLAKLTERAAGGLKLSAAPTMTAGEQTTTGAVLGTAGYMAPEQVRGQAVDARADVFSFGAILYEAATVRGGILDALHARHPPRPA
jgi:serine/threonine protein kinase